MRVLHVTEAFGGGTESAIRGFVEATGDYEHHLLYRDRGDTGTGEGLEGFRSAVPVTSGVLGLRAVARARVSDLRPDVVHLHSSWAGLVCRAAGGVGDHAGVVYSPHCFYFERTDIGAARRWMGARVERMLAASTDVVVAVSPREEELARSLGARRTYVVRNTLAPRATGPRPASEGTPVIATMGRITRQKDPDFFLEVAEVGRSAGIDAEWVWIGGGDDREVRRLQQRGIRVTGWLPRAEARSRVGDATVYIHTAAWESGPVSVEEARSAGVPTVVRSIPSMVSLGFPDGVDTPRQMVMRIGEALRRSDAGPDVAAPEDGSGTNDLRRRSAGLRAAYSAAREAARGRAGRSAEKAFTS